MVNNIQPRLSKIGKSLSFQNNKSISSDANGFALTNNDGTAANLSTGDLNSVNINASGKTAKLYTDIVAIKDNKLFLNTEGNNVYQQGGIYLGEKEVILPFDISGLNSDTISIHYEKVFLCASLLLSTEDNVYSFNVGKASSFFMLSEALQLDKTFTDNFEIVASGTDLIISSKFSTIISIFFSGISVKKLVYNNGWQFDDGIVIDNTVISSDSITVASENVKILADEIVTKNTYIPTKEESLVNKKYLDLLLSSWKAGLKLQKTHIFAEISIDVNNKIICLPAIYRAVGNWTLCNFTYGENEFSLSIVDNYIRLSNGETTVSTLYNLDKIYNFIIVTKDGNIQLLDGRTLILETPLIGTGQTTGIDLFDNTLLKDGSVYACNYFSVYNYSDIILNNIINMGSDTFDGDNCLLNLMFDRLYDVTRIPDSVGNIVASVIEGNLFNNKVNSDLINYD